MAALAEIHLRISVTDVSGLAIVREPPPVRFGPGAGTTGQRQSVALPGATFTALVPPAGSKLVVLMLGQATALVLKAVTGDQGFPLSPVANPLGVDCIFSLGSNPSLGILNNNGAAQSIDVLWL